MRKQNKFILLFCALLLASCANNNMDNHNEQNVVTSEFNPQRWLAEGKIALRYPYCRKNRACEEKAINAGIEWTHVKQSETLAIIDPLGQEQMRIHYDNGSIVVRENQKDKAMSREELNREVGVPLPLESLASWVTTPRQEESFEADGWKVELRDWQGAYYRSIRLKQKDYQMRLVVQKMFVI
ncbi:MAG: outer membrane lipoprotein LolB [Cardiobacteriaceae bacterium]|nr:outer membrane lipoprotein LolB [Cardiobacteriaceae bacterium]